MRINFRCTLGFEVSLSSTLTCKLSTSIAVVVYFISVQQFLLTTTLHKPGIGVFLEPLLPGFEVCMKNKYMYVQYIISVKLRILVVTYHAWFEMLCFHFRSKWSGTLSNASAVVQGICMKSATFFLAYYCTSGW